ncbi:hypothetical protein REPUB_Repub05bG0201000 [Reevesia pubescens]
MASSPGGSKIFQWNFNILNHTSFHSCSRALLLLLIFFFLVIFITTLFLYAHWICGQHILSTAADTQVNATAADHHDPSLGLGPDSINSLPIILHRSLVTNNEGKHGFIGETECSICLGVFEDEQKLKVLPECNHAYHSECVDKWLSSHSSCPLCRTSLTPIITP